MIPADLAIGEEILELKTYPVLDCVAWMETSAFAAIILQDALGEPG